MANWTAGVYVDAWVGGLVLVALFAGYAVLLLGITSRRAAMPAPSSAPRLPAAWASP